MRLRTTMALVASATTLAALGTAPAQAAEGANRLSGPSTGDPDVFLTYVGCDNLFGAAQPPQSRLNLGPYTAPMGRRSLGLVPAAPGTASGPFTRFDSLASFDSTVAVASTSGSQGVSYVMSITPDNVPGTAWRGRAALSAPPGSWTTVSTAATAYDWTLVDLATLSPLGARGDRDHCRLRLCARRRRGLLDHRLRLRRLVLQHRRGPRVGLDRSTSRARPSPPRSTSTARRSTPASRSR